MRIRNYNIKIYDKFNRITILGDRFYHNKGKSSPTWMYFAVCDCGNFMTVAGNNLVSKRIQSCGCLKINLVIKRNTTHNESKTRLYRTWADMVARCHIRKDSDYLKSGITVCEKWRRYENFAKWAKENGYNDNLEIDRINNDQGYHPSNCRFVSCRDNVLNRRVTIHLTAFGETKPLTKWLEDDRCKTSYRTLIGRISIGIPTEEAITTAGRIKWEIHPKDIEIKAFNEIKKVQDWLLDERCLAKSASTILYRINIQKWSPERALGTQAYEK